MPSIQVYLYMKKFDIKKALETVGITQLNAMQALSIEAFQASQEPLLILSPTGSGKTLAFLIPLLSELPINTDIQPQVFIVAPTRELTIQIDHVARSLKSPFKISTCYGGHDFSIEKKSVAENPDIIIGTPGRLVDHVRRESFDATTIQYLIVDEYDKLLEMGFERDLQVLIDAIHPAHRKVFTSATKIKANTIIDFSSFKELNFLKEEAMPSTLNFKLITSERNDAFIDLCALLCELKNNKAMVFLNQRNDVDELYMRLQNEGFSTAIFHGGLDQIDREKALIKFRNGTHTVLLSTDLAARGLDIPQVDHIIHYQLPNTKSEFIHRSGRTARMLQEGSVYVFQVRDEKLPFYMDMSLEALKLPAYQAQNKAKALWETLYISAGKKDKINKVDIVGLLMQKGGLSKDDIGLIEVLDHASFIAIPKNKIENLIQSIKFEKIKKQRVKFDIAR